MCTTLEVGAPTAVDVYEDMDFLPHVSAEEDDAMQSALRAYAAIHPEMGS